MSTSNWEVIVIDNASKDDTSKIATELLAAALPAEKFTVAKEPMPGLIHARNKGVSLARYDYLLFCDDDNWLAPDYLQQAYTIMEANPKIGILGGQGVAAFEGEEPAWFQTYQLNFAVGDQAEASNERLIKLKAVYGAGFMVQKDFFKKLDEIKFSSLLSGRKGNEVISGEDSELCFVARFMGYEIWYSRNLHFQHLMTAGRMNWEYLKKLHYGFGRMRVYTQMYQYVETHNQVPGQHLKYPLWLDKYIHTAKRLTGFLPGILFKMKEEGNDQVLKYMALRGELYELKKMGKAYPVIYKRILELKNRFNGKL